jgi:Tol biopolymer transport system component/C-terminal processing protease CtpA/Prc
MKRSVLLLLLTLFCFSGFSQNEALWLRYPSISPDGSKIAFTYKGDIYVVSSAGGTATAITLHEAEDFMPVWSHDGKTIAFASNRYGNFDIFVMPSTGGEPKRLTWHSSNEYPYAFTPDDITLIFGGVRQDAASHRQYPTESQPEVYKVPVNGGRIDQLWTIPAENITVSRDGNLYVYHDKKGGENEWRKHHTSSITRDIWIWNRSTGSHTMLSTFKGEDRSPVFSPDEKSLYYLSEESGSFNVHNFLISDPGQKKQITFFRGGPVRFLSASEAGRLCFGYDGSIYTLEPGGQPQKLAVTIITSGKTNVEKVIAVNGNVREMAVSPDGKEVAFIVRGEVFVSSADGGITKRITNTPEEERFIGFSPSGDSLIYASERSGTWKIFLSKIVRSEEPYFYASTLIREEPLISGSHDSYQPKISPDGKEIAFIEDRRSLKVFNIKTKQVRTLISPENMIYMSEGDQYFQWSPDSKWILAEYSPIMSNSEVALIPADGRSPMINLTRSGYNDSRPVWVNGGRQMLWFSDRDGLRSYANSGSRQADVYNMFFTRDAWDRFRMSKEDYALLKEIENKAKEKEKKEKESADKKKKAQEVKKDTSVVFDMEGIYDRKARLTIHSSDLGDAVLSKDGEKLYYLARFEKGLNLWSTNLRTKETKMELSLDADRANLMWDKDMKSLFLLADGKITKINPEGWKKEAVSFRGELILDLNAEREVMFSHVWHRTKAMFYISTFHGANWDQLYTDYKKFLPHIGTGFEFSELLSEMLGELNVSHSGSRYNSSDPGDDNTASLGIFMDYGYTGNGIRIEEIIKGGPLDKSSINLKPGMIIEQIDGDTIGSERDVASLLNRKAGKFTLLSVFDPVTKTRQNISMKPVTRSEENTLLYKRWVQKNQDEVDKLGNGSIGYVHVPGMSDGPYRTVYEEMMGKYADRKGVIVDTRFNGGGDLVSDLTMFFTGKKYLEYSTEKREVGYEPNFRWNKPTVAMFNEANYSDGHCFACGYKELGIGKTIGMPVPGTCSYAGWEMLQDGETRWGAVPVSTKDINGNWLENVETVPDIQVKNEPGIISTGRDQQLEQAAAELLKVVN